MSKNGKVENQAASGTTITRRELVTRAGLGAGALLLTSGMPEAFAAAPSKTIKVGFVSPLSGPLAGFGEGDPYVLGLVRKKLASRSVANTMPSISSVRTANPIRRARANSPKNSSTATWSI